MKLKESLVRSYIWRMKNPEKYKALVKRYFEKKRQKQENDAIKAAVNIFYESQNSNASQFLSVFTVNVTNVSEKRRFVWGLVGLWVRCGH